MFFLPNRPTKIGIFLSGGLDSALLYYLIKNEAQLGLHSIMPIVIKKTEYTIPTVTKILDYFNNQHPLTVVKGPIQNAITKCPSYGCSRVYVGTIKELPEFLINWQSSTYPESLFFRTPFKDLNKSDIVKLALKEKQEKLFEITHSCAVLPIGRCGTCNRCRERAWAFNSLDLIDPGVL